jgi:hypothetical protein
VGQAGRFVSSFASQSRIVTSGIVVMHFWFDPIRDPRWMEFVNRRPDSSIFHTPEWMSALQRTYGFTPVGITLSPPDTELASGIVFCRVQSIVTGKRLVSLPFSDHCQPLATENELQEIIQAVMETLNRDCLKYVELRPPSTPAPSGLFAAQRFLLHILDLRPQLNDILRRFHANCVRRKIRRAEREGLVTDAGRSESLLQDFYALQVITRKRHGLPPQPLQWFRNLILMMGEKATIRVARSFGRPIAAILMLRHRQIDVYKYGCSLASDNNRGGMQLLLWKAIEDAKTHGIDEIDLGRCDIGDTGLAEFKERWGAERREMHYYRYPERKPQIPSKSSLVAWLPKPVLIAIGRLLYRHLG